MDDEDGSRSRQTVRRREEKGNFREYEFRDWRTGDASSCLCTVRRGVVGIDSFVYGHIDGAAQYMDCRFSDGVQDIQELYTLGDGCWHAPLDFGLVLGLSSG